MKSSYEKDLESVNTRSNLYIGILILIEQDISLSNNVILSQENKIPNMSHGGKLL